MNNLKTKFAWALCALLLSLAGSAKAGDLQRIQFTVLDAQTGKLATNAEVVIEDMKGGRKPCAIVSGRLFDVAGWRAVSELEAFGQPVKLVEIALGKSVILTGQAQPPIKDIYVKVTARLIPKHANAVSPGATVDRNKIEKLTGAAGGNISSIIKTESGVASDSAGQQHVRGEHAEISYVVDGVPLPDTLSGRQGSVVVPSTIERLEFLTGGYAPEFGGQTAAILNIATLPNAKESRVDLGMVAGSFDTTNGDLTAAGPIGEKASYVIDIGATRTRNYVEPQQPDAQTAHNAGASLSEFVKVRYSPTKADTLTLTVSSNPTSYQVNNRTGLPASFASAGEGYGFLGIRNADGTIPSAVAINPGGLGSAVIPLASQQDDGMDITARELSEFATLLWKHNLSSSTTGTLSLTFLHAQQDLSNQNPAVNLLQLPVDNSIEYNPTSTRDVHHIQWAGSLEQKQSKHDFKAGFLIDEQNGDETYQITPASQLALDELAALGQNLAPTGAVQTDAKGNPVLDVNGNPVYISSSSAAPVVSVHRSGFYRAGYAQDTWKVSRKFTANLGVRADWYDQTETIDTTSSLVNTLAVSPRFNFSYNLNRMTTMRWSYNRLFNTPPLAQGAIVGEPIQPERLDQFDISIEHQASPRQTVSLAYYVKQMRDQVDTGLLIPGSQIGLYSAVNFQIGAVHGIEFAYDLAAGKDKQGRAVGVDASFTYTYSIAAPNGMDNTGAAAPDYNDHDQRNTVGLNVGYTYASGVNTSLAFSYGSGLTSSIVPPSVNRTPRTQVDWHWNTGQRFLKKRVGFGLDVLNVFDERSVINFESGFSGTRFMQARTIQMSLTGKF